MNGTVSREERMGWKARKSITLKEPWMKWDQKKITGGISSTIKALTQEKCDASIGCHPDKTWTNLGEKQEGQLGSGHLRWEDPL